MLKSRKGLSAVIATILIVLLAVVAVTIVWAILKPSITKTAEKVDVKCLGVDLSLDKCTKAGSVTVTLNSGNITKLKIAFYDANGNAIGDVETEGTDFPKELERKTYSYSLSNVVSANVATFVTSETTGEEISCGFVLAKAKECVES